MKDGELHNKKMSIHDISVILQNGMPHWPGDIGFNLHFARTMDNEDVINVSQIECSAHAGTHVDAPSHNLPNGCTVEKISLEILIGPAQVVYLPDVSEISSDTLSSLDLAPNTERLLFRTKNSKWWKSGVKEFRQEFVALTLDAAYWLINNGIRLIGIDYLSIQRFQDGPRTHQVLLGAGVVLLEGLNLADVCPGTYELICLPLRIESAEGAPARAVLRTL